MPRFWPPPAPTPTPGHWKIDGREASARPDAYRSPSASAGPGVKRRRMTQHKAAGRRKVMGLRMSQTEFAKAFHIPVGTLRDWEQHRRDPDQAARAYLEAIARNPKAVIAALHPRLRLPADQPTARGAASHWHGATMPALAWIPGTSPGMTCAMAVFRYTALNQAGKQISGEMEAKSRELVIRHLAEAGHFPIDAVAQSTSAAAASSRSLMDFWQSASATQITQFTRQLAMLLGAGLTLPRAMAPGRGRDERRPRAKDRPADPRRHRRRQEPGGGAGGPRQAVSAGVRQHGARGRGERHAARGARAHRRDARARAEDARQADLGPALPLAAGGDGDRARCWSSCCSWCRASSRCWSTPGPSCRRRRRP